MNQFTSLFENSTFFSSSLQKLVVESCQVIEKALKIYNKRNIAICFNGGKDATVLLDLVNRVSNGSVTAFYLDDDNDFDEIKDFLGNSEKYWKMKLIKLQTNSLKSGLSSLIDNYNISAVFLGVRNSDFKKPIQDEFEPTTEGWPEAMRVMPILKWNYHDIWEYITILKIPVCSLYEKGYTSIGSKIDTLPNPNLFDIENGTYKHARFLENAADERKGRTKK